VPVAAMSVFDDRHPERTFSQSHGWKLMTDTPRCLASPTDFPHRAELVAAVANGAMVRKDSRALSVGSLVGTYTIRLKTAQSHGTRTQISDLTFLVDNLQGHIDRNADVWYVHTGQGTKFHLFECSDNGIALGCLHAGVAVATAR
jgi:hypothetical protein